MNSKTISIFTPGLMLMIIGFFTFGILGAAIGLVIGLAMGESYYSRQEQTKENKN
jgi:hypothetical protein